MVGEAEVKRVTILMDSPHKGGATYTASRKMAGSAPASDARDWGAIETWAAGLPTLFERSA